MREEMLGGRRTWRTQRRLSRRCRQSSARRLRMNRAEMIMGGYGYLWDVARRTRFFSCPFFLMVRTLHVVFCSSPHEYSRRRIEDSRVKAITEDFLLRALNYSINLEWSLDGICSTFHSHPLCQSPTHCFLHPSTISLEICIWLH